MNLWLLRLPFRHLHEHPGRSLLGILSIALGTAVYLSIALASTSALKSFQAGVAAVAGQAQLRLQSPGAALNEDLFPAVRRLPVVKYAAPVVETMVDIKGPESHTALLLGIDPFSEAPLRDYRFLSGSGLDREDFLKFLTRPGWVMLSAPLATRLHLKPGDTFTAAVGAKIQQLHVAGIFRTPGELYPLDGAVLLMDVGQAQELLDRVGQTGFHRPHRPRGSDRRSRAGAPGPAAGSGSRHARGPGPVHGRPGGGLSSQPVGAQRHCPVCGDVPHLPVRDPLRGPPAPGDRSPPDPGHDQGPGHAPLSPGRGLERRPRGAFRAGAGRGPGPGGPQYGGPKPDLSVSAGAGRGDLVGGPGISPGLGSGRGRHPPGLLDPGPGGLPDQGQGRLV